ncbi:3'-5' exonuclease [Streptomyces sp. NPDC002172]
MTLAQPSELGDLFSLEVDERPVQFVRPADTDRPDWGVYDDSTARQFLGMVHSELSDGAQVWRVGATAERHGTLDDAVRALRRPASWPRERSQVQDWARRVLADESLLSVDVETTGLGDAWAVQIAATDRTGTVVFNEYVNPLADIDPKAVALHKITPERVADAATFAELLPELTKVMAGRRCLFYNMSFDRGVFERELKRHHGADAPAAQWLDRCRWEDAMEPYAVWKGLWSVKRGRYRAQKLGGPHDAVEDCRVLLSRVEQMAAVPPSAHR